MKEKYAMFWIKKIAALEDFLNISIKLTFVRVKIVFEIFLDCL